MIVSLSGPEEGSPRSLALGVSFTRGQKLEFPTNTSSHRINEVFLSLMCVRCATPPHGQCGVDGPRRWPFLTGPFLCSPLAASLYKSGRLMTL